MKSKNFGKYKIICISLKPILNELDFNDLLINKRYLDFKNNQITLSLPNHLFQFIDSQDNRTKYLTSLVKKYLILLKNVENEIFFDFAEFIRFFIYLEYFEFMNDIKFEINSCNIMKIKIEKSSLKENKNGLITEIQDGKEYLREYKDGLIIKENEIIKRG